MALNNAENKSSQPNEDIKYSVYNHTTPRSQLRAYFTTANDYILAVQGKYFDIKAIYFLQPMSLKDINSCSSCFKTMRFEGTGRIWHCKNEYPEQNNAKENQYT